MATNNRLANKAARKSRARNRYRRNPIHRHNWRDSMTVHTMSSKWRVERCHCGLARIDPGSLASTLNAESAANGKSHNQP